ncbi:unnamed protein product [Brassica rapa subsp. narinosa]
MHLQAMENPYLKSSGKGIYYPTAAELKRFVPYNGHYLFAIGASRDRDDKLFYQCQDSYGLTKDIRSSIR